VFDLKVHHEVVRDDPEARKVYFQILTHEDKAEALRPGA
jgi:hypothetical protein